MKPTTQSIYAARKLVESHEASARWAESHLYCALVAMQTGNGPIARRELGAAREHVRRWTRTARAITRQIDQATQSLDTP